MTMKKMIVAAAVGFLGLGMAGSAPAAENAQGVQCKTVKASQRVQFRQGEVLPGTHLLGKCIQGVHGNRLGEVKEMMIDAGRGQIAYLVVAPDPSLGIGEKGRLVPWTALHTDPETGALVANIEADKFKEAPAEVADRQQAEEIHKLYGVAPYWEEGGKKAPLPGKEGREELIPKPTPLWWE
jgi:sporulation protein YlmC with PRC-barrel domain